MDPTTSLTKALFNNAHNPKLAWHLFKRILSSPSSDLRLCSLPVIARILIDSKMHREIDSLHQLLLHSQPLETLRPCLPSLMLILAKLNLPNKAVAHFKSLRSRFPDEPPSVYLYNLLLESSLTENYVDFVLWLLLYDAREVFDKMRGKGCLPNEYSVGILVRGYYRAGLAGRGLEVWMRTDEAEKLVERMDCFWMPLLPILGFQLSVVPGKSLKLLEYLEICI
ncbi:hypothetical protein ACFX15_034576 [Malus domestica]